MFKCKFIFKCKFDNYAYVCYVKTKKWFHIASTILFPVFRMQTNFRSKSCKKDLWTQLNAALQTNGK